MLRALQTLLVHNYNEQQAMQRAVQARAQGLDPLDYASVFPGSTITTTHHHAPPSTGSGYVKGSLVTAALLAAVGAGTYGVLRNDTQPPGKATPVPEAAQKMQDYDAVYEEQQKDGTWRQLKRERLKLREGK